MKKINKALSIFLLSVVLLIPLVSCEGDYETQTEGQTSNSGDMNSEGEAVKPSTPTSDFEYELIDGGISINRYVGSSLKVTVPNTIDGKDVIRIGDEAFARNYDIETIVLPNSIKSFGNQAFAFCFKLQEITLPTSLETMQFSVFSNCDSLKELYIPDSVTSMKANILDETHLDKLEVDPNNTVYDSRNHCNAIIETKTNTMIASSNNTYIPKSVEIIESGCFDGTKLERIVIPSGIKEIGAFNFTSAKNLTSLEVDPDNTVYDSRNKCNGIIETSTNTLMFGCNNTVIPSGVETIANGAFRGLDFETMNIPLSVTTIEENAFLWCDKLKTIKYGGDEADFAKVNNEMDFSGIEIVYGKVIKDVVDFDCTYTLINDDITNLVWTKKDYKGVELIRRFEGKRILSLGDNAFDGCKDLMWITLPSSITSIGNNAFNGCTSLIEVFYGSSIDQWNKIDIANAGNNDLLMANIDYKTTISPYASLMPLDNDDYTCIYITKRDIYAAKVKGNNTNVDFNEVFSNFDVYTLAPKCFMNSNVSSVILPDTLKEIAVFSFANTTNLKSIEIPSNVTSIRNSAFLNSFISSITLPNSLTSIEDSAFEGCNNLNEVKFNGTKEEWNNIIIGRNNSILNQVSIVCSDGTL